MAGKQEYDLNVDLPEGSVKVTCTAPVNIAVIKYWGKRDTVRILPVNSSLSATIAQGSMRSKTTIIASKSFEQDHMFLNGQPVEVNSDKRLQAVIKAIRERAGDYSKDGKVVIPKGEWGEYKLRIVSSNNFPTAAGLASSASGLACFAACLAELFSVKETYEGELSTIARQGSGSACRSMYGGFVQWIMGEREDGVDSIAQQVAPVEHWPEMRVLICVVNEAKKKTSSTSGMQTSVKTSPLLKFRADTVVPKRQQQMIDAIKARDFTSFADLTMQDSNQFHAVCLDTYPPIFYMNDTSKRIIDVVEAFNAAAGKPVAAYTFDAGPNAVIYTLDKDMDELLDVLLRYFKPAAADSKEFVNDKVGVCTGRKATAEQLATVAKLVGEPSEADAVGSIIASKVGEGPIIVENVSSH